MMMEAQSAPTRLMPYLTATGHQKGSRPTEAIKGFHIGDIDLADFVRDWQYESTQSMDAPSGTPTSEIMAQYMEENPDRAKAFEYLKQVVQMYDEYAVASWKAIQAGEDVGAVNDMYMKKYGKELMKAQKQLPKLFGKRGGPGGFGSGPEARQKRAAAAKKQARAYDAGDQRRMQQRHRAERDKERQTFEEAQQIDELGLGRALKGMGGALKGKAFDKIKGMKGPVAQHVQAEKQIQGIVADMIKKDPSSANSYVNFLTKLVKSITPAAGFDE